MSYLQMRAYPGTDMQKGIISFWFRDISKQQPKLTPAIVWPQGFWTEANADKVMVPPNAQYQVGYDPLYGGDPAGPPGNTPATSSLFYMNPYGLPQGAEFFGDAFLGPAAVWIPNSPPLPVNTLSSTVSGFGGVADTDMSKDGIRTLLTFGDDTIPYNYAKWKIDKPDVIPAVQYASSFGFVIYQSSPPYFIYDKHLGNDGKFVVCNYRLADSPETKGSGGQGAGAPDAPPGGAGGGGNGGGPIEGGGGSSGDGGASGEWRGVKAHDDTGGGGTTPPDGTGGGGGNGGTSSGTVDFTKKVPQSFIGFDSDGHIVINLQTSTKATMKGMAFEISSVDELWGTATGLHIDGPPFSYAQIGFPFPDGHWEETPGYWNGYQFDYNDISDKVMGAAPESFLLYARPAGFLDFTNGPTITDGGWHHLLFSFDISGSVSVTQPSAPIAADGTVGTQPPPQVSTKCKAWLAIDDVNYNGAKLQNRPLAHDGLLLPKLRGTETTQILDCGPCTTMGRGKLGDNDILPRNAWLTGYGGNPKDNLQRFVSNSGVVGNDPTNCADQTAQQWGAAPGDFNWLAWTGAIWPLYGHGVAPGPWQATFQPPAPTAKDPKDFDAPTYQCDNFTIPLMNHPIGIPAGAALGTEYNTGVEMAELQIWIGQTGDTSDQNFRRLFVDKNGKPVGTGTAKKQLGEPDIMLHGSSNWKNGRNTGKSGYTEEDAGDGTKRKVPNPAGQFDHIAAIKTFLPDPKLGQ